MPIEPMLATAGEPGDVWHGDWAMEMKWDGLRIIAEIAAGVVRLWSRNGRDLTPAFTDLLPGILHATDAEHAIVDGGLRGQA